MTPRLRASRKARSRAYRFTDERIRELLAVPIALRLRRLEETNRFLDKALTPEARRIRELFRQGKLSKGTVARFPPRRSSALPVSPRTPHRRIRRSKP